MPRITLINNPMHDLEILRQLTPPGLDVAIVERRGENFAAVLRDTEPVTFPPAAMIISGASSRVRVGSVHVRTSDLPASRPSVPRAPGP